MTRLFDIAGGGARSDVEANLRWLRILLLVHVAVRTVFRLRHAPYVQSDPYVEIVCQVLIVCCLAGLIPRLRQLAIQMAAGLMAIQVVLTLPVTANHAFLDFFCLVFLALLREAKEDEDELAIKALRWMVVIVLFYSGLQKVVYGRYFDGQFLAHAAATEDRFAFFLRLMMPSEEFARLRAMQAAEVGMGPYRVDSILFVAVSNSVYVLEMVLSVLLLIRRTRAFAALVAILFVITIQLGARELMFGVLMINLVLLFRPGPWIKRLFPAFAVMYAYLVASEFDLVPMFLFYH